MKLQVVVGRHKDGERWAVCGGNEFVGRPAEEVARHWNLHDGSGLESIADVAAEGWTFEWVVLDIPEPVSFVKLVVNRDRDTGEV